MDNGTKRLAEVLPAITATEAAEVETRERRFSWTELERLDFANVPDRLTDPMIAKLEALAAVVIPGPAPCRESEFFAAMATLRVNLPSQKLSEDEAVLQAKTYFQMLGGYTLAQIERMVEIALTACEFFPTIARCTEILSGVPMRDELAEKQRKAKDRIFREYNIRRFEQQGAFETAMRRLANGLCDQAEVDALPDAWKSHAVEYGYLRAVSFEIRPAPAAISADEEPEA